MKYFRFLVWGMVLISLVFTLILFFLAPHHIVMHFNDTGMADNWGNRVGLFLQPVLLAVITFICDRLASSRRKRDGLETMTIITYREWRFVSFIFVVLLIIGGLQLYQLSWLH
ncbi:MAG TPA: hypothetical protein DDW71_08615 [Lactobacillus sp.]|nr:hypothetical protein [Lactobacillus sp.]